MLSAKVSRFLTIAAHAGLHCKRFQVFLIFSGHHLPWVTGEANDTVKVFSSWRYLKTTRRLMPGDRSSPAVPPSASVAFTSWQRACAVISPLIKQSERFLKMKPKLRLKILMKKATVFNAAVRTVVGHSDRTHHFAAEFTDKLLCVLWSRSALPYLPW